MSYRHKHVKTKIKNLKPKRKFYARPIFWLIILFLSLILFSFYFFVFYPKFQIKNISVSGNKKVQTSDLKSAVFKIINKKIFNFGGFNVYSKSIFLVNSEKINEEIKKEYPVIGKISISKEYPDSINFQTEERETSFLFCQDAKDENCFLADRNGVVFERANVLNEYFIVRLDDLLGQIFLGRPVISKEVVEKILKIQQNLKDNFQVDIKEVLVQNSTRLNIKTSEGWQIYFDLNSDVNLQIARLNSLLKSEIAQKDRPKIQYIDLRFKDRAYYK